MAFQSDQLSHFPEGHTNEGQPRGKKAPRRTSDRSDITRTESAHVMREKSPRDVESDQDNPDRVTSGSRTRRAKGGKIKGQARDDTTYLKGQNILPSIQQEQDVIGKQSLLCISQVGY